MGFKRLVCRLVGHYWTRSEAARYMEHPYTFVVCSRCGATSAL